MNIKNIVVVLTLILLAMGGYYFLGSGDKSSESNNTQNDASQSELETSDRQQGRGALLSFLGQGRSVMCTFSHQDAETSFKSEGEFYFDGVSEKFRVDSTTNDENETYVTHMINDGEFTYLWSEETGDQAFAMKMSADIHTKAEAQEFVDSNNDNNKPVSLEEEVEYDCNSWSVDGTKFIPPSNVEFMDMASMMQEMMGGLPEGFDLPAGFPGQ